MRSKSIRTTRASWVSWVSWSSKSPASAQQATSPMMASARGAAKVIKQTMLEIAQKEIMAKANMTCSNSPMWWMGHEMSCLVLVSRWISGRFMVFHDVSTLTLKGSFSKKENIVKTQRRLKETVSEHFVSKIHRSSFNCLISISFRLCRLLPQEKPGTYPQERRNSRRWQQRSNLENH